MIGPLVWAIVSSDEWVAFGHGYIFSRRQTNDWSAWANVAGDDMDREPLLGCFHLRAMFTRVKTRVATRCAKIRQSKLLWQSQSDMDM